MRVVGPRPGNPRRDHVAVADRLDLLDLVAVDDFVKSREQTIEHPDDLARVESARKRSEVDDVREEDAGVVEVVRDRVGLGLQALGDLLGKDVEQERLDACLCSVSSSREGYEQQHRHKRHRDDVEDDEGPDESLGKVGAGRPHDFGENEREHDDADEGPEPGPGARGSVEGDGAERRKKGPQDHRARVLEAAEHDRPERGRDQDQNELRCPQEREISVPSEHGEADDRSGDIGPRRERDRLLTHDPIQAAPEEPNWQDEERDPDEQPFAEAQLRRVGGVRPDRQNAGSQRRDHDGPASSTVALGPSVASVRPTRIGSADVALAGLRQAASSSLKKTLRGVRAPAPVQVPRLGRGSRSARLRPSLVVSLRADDRTSRRAHICSGWSAGPYSPASITWTSPSIAMYSSKLWRRWSASAYCCASSTGALRVSSAGIASMSLCRRRLGSSRTG